jgi:hypothetical protein
MPHTSRSIVLFKILKSDRWVKSYKICELPKEYYRRPFLSPIVYTVYSYIFKISTLICLCMCGWVCIACLGYVCGCRSSLTNKHSQIFISGRRRHHKRYSITAISLHDIFALSWIEVRKAMRRRIQEYYARHLRSRRYVICTESQ